MGIRDVWAVRDCTVICVKPDDGKRAYGNTVYYRDQDGTIIMCAHLDWYAVKAGDKLKKGDVFAEIGSTGYCPGGAHLHVSKFPTGCRRLFAGNAIDPLPYFEKYGYPCITLITNYYGSKHFNKTAKTKTGEPSLKKHEGLDFSSWRKRDEKA